MLNKIYIYYPPADGLVKLKLRLNEPIAIRWGGPNEEGYSYEEEVYTLLSNGMVEVEASSMACDCDGPISSYWKGYAPVEDFIEADRRRIRWQESDYEVRDVYAEAMGY